MAECSLLGWAHVERASDARGCEGLACPAVAPVPRPGAAPYSSSYCFSNTPTLFTAWPWAFAPFVVTVIVFPS
jgi:hypothetical protein